ncbi:MAG: MG2 domain-containing protein [Verrucomicrobiales bacterium]
MKMFLRIVVSATVGWIAFTSAIAQEPIESSPTLNTGGGKYYTAVSPVEVRFPGTMVTPEVVGNESGSPSPIAITPELDGTFVWRSQRSGTFTLSALPPMATRFTVTTVPGLKDAEGALVPEMKIGTFETAPADVVAQYPRYFSQHELPRELVVTYFFDAEVDLRSARKSVRFVDSNGAIVLANVRYPIGKELPEASVPIGTREQQFYKNRPEIQENTVIKSALVISPALPLPEGDDWTVVWEPIATEGNQYTAANPGRLLGNVPAFLVSKNHFVQRYDSKDSIEITFNKELGRDMTAEKLMRWVTVDPQPEGMTVVLSDRSFRINGNFERRTYHVTVAKGLPSADGTLLKQLESKTHKVQAMPPHLSVPAFGATQYSHGNKTFEIIAANLASVRVRVKQVEPRDAAQAMAAYQLYNSNRDNGETSEKTSKDQLDYVPFQVVQGKTVCDQVFTSAVGVDESDKFLIDWDEVLGAEVTAALLFVSVEGTMKDEVKLENAKEKGTMIAQSLLQITDIGLAWKRTNNDALVYAFSQTTGEPLPGVVLKRYDVDASATGRETITDALGMTTVPFGDARWLVAQKDEDAQAIRFGEDLPLVSMWQFGVPIEWRSVERQYRETHMFTERPLYKPEETVHLKCLTRMVQGSKITLPENREAKLKLYDPEGRLHFTRDITFTDRGSFSGDIDLPTRDTGLGTYRIEVSFVDPGEEAAVENMRERSFDHYIFVQEFKPNAFAVTMGESGGGIDSDAHTFPMSAQYLMGKALAKSKVTWSASIYDSAFGSDKWPGFVFGDSRSDWVYAGDGYREYEAVSNRQRSHSLSGNTELDDAGAATVLVPVAKQEQYPSRRMIELSTSVTDINQQTISASVDKIVDSSDFYLGIRLKDDVLQVGQTNFVEFAAVDLDDSQHKEAVQTQVKIEKLLWNTVKVEGAGGAVTVKNFLSLIDVQTQTITVQPGGENSVSLAPDAPGTYVVTASCADASGRSVVSATTLTVYGDGDVYWHQQEGVRLELTADKKEYQPGDEAMIVVKSAVHGSALVTVERDTVRQQFITEITGDAQAIPVKVSADDTPNVFVSVLLVRGGADSPKKFPRPEYRLGYCELKVKNTMDGLNVRVASDAESYRPGTRVSASANVTDTDGKPVANAEVTLYAVDQGVLDLMAYQLPNPFDHFHQPQRLAVQAGSSLATLLEENPDDRDFGNKGVIIGGGGLMALPKGQMRRNFKACAFWSGDLLTDSEGRTTATFDAPDNLTEYHLFAVAAEGAARFGGGEARFTVNKPIMLEPGLPRFANVGDQIVAKAIVHNTSAHGGDFRVTLKLDETAEHVGAELEPARTKTMALAPGQSAAVSFPVAMIAVGEAKWDWSVTPATESKPEWADLVDSVESSFPVTWPVPELHESHYQVVTDAAVADNMLAGVNPELLEGDGQIELTVSTSPLINARGAIEQVLHYPYGCIEQTTSATLPWLTLKDLRSALPELNKTDAQIADAIEFGCRRLLSMQTRSGGLGYWPGSDEPMLWGSSYAGMVLALAKRDGISLPQDRIDQLCSYLSAQLRDSGKETDGRQLNDRCLAAYTLALFGKAEPAYHSVLKSRAKDIRSSGRAFLALAILEARAPNTASQAKELLEMAAPESDMRDRYFDPAAATSLIAWCRMSAPPKKLTAAFQRLIGGRSLRGDWHNTYLNGWSLLALGDYTRIVSKAHGDLSITASFLGNSKELRLNNGDKLSATAAFSFRDGNSLDKLKLQLPDGVPLFTTVDVTARPLIAPQQARINGDYSITRTYEELAPDGTRSPPTNLEIGDLVLVKLEGSVTAQSEFVVVDDALPAILEAINPSFQSRTAAANVPRGAFRWYSDHQELRTERTLYFRDYIYGGGKFAIEYLTRVIADGTVTAPPAKIEAMYDPGKLGLSDSIILKSATAGN